MNRVYNIDMFTSPFARPFSKPFPQDAVATPWWLAGGIATINCVAAYQPKGAVSLAASYVNLANPGIYNAAPGVAPAWDAIKGWQFDGLSKYLEIGLLPTPSQTVSVQFANIVVKANGSCPIGSYNGITTRFWLDPYENNSGHYFGYGNSSSGPTAPGYTNGNLICAGGVFYYNGSVVVTIGTFSGTAASFYIGARHRGDLSSQDAYFYGDILGISVYDTIIPAPQVLALSNAMNAL